MLLYENVSEKDVWNYWKTLFPEVKKDQDIRKMLSINKSFNENKLAEFWNEHKADISGFMDWLSLQGEGIIIYDEWRYPVFENHINNIFYPIILYRQVKLLRLKKYIKNELFLEGEAIFSDLLSDIVLRLREISIRTFITEINVERAEKKLKGNSPNDRYLFYTDQKWKSVEYIRNFYSEYSELFDCQIKVLDNAIDSYIEMLERTDRAYKDIKKVFGYKDENLKIKKIISGLGDSHKCGRTVSSIEFTNGKKIIYKPRSLGTEAGFNKYLKKINKGLELRGRDLYIPKVLNLGSYGFMEYISHKSCKNKKQVEDYFYRCGLIMAMLYSLNAKDIHHENIIAHGQYPVMIDLEALFHSSLEYKDVSVEKTAYDVAIDSIDDSVYSIGLLPMKLVDPGCKENGAVDISGLGGTEAQASPFKILMIQNKETDEICLKKSDYLIDVQKNIVRYKEQLVNPADYKVFIKAGFEKAYKYIEKNRQELAKDFYSWFRGVRARIIYRPTYLYTRLMFTGSHPDFMREKAHRYVLMHRMAYKVKDKEKAIVSSEIRDMMRGDVPFFEVDVNTGVLYDSESNEFSLVFKKTPLGLVEEKIFRFSKEDLKDQINIIESAFISKSIEEYKDVWLTGLKWNKEKAEIKKAEYIKTAKTIADRILKAAKVSIVDGEKELCWVNYNPVGHDEIYYEYGPLESDLYSGTTGIGLFLIYLWKKSGDDKYLNAAYACIRPVIRAMEQIDSDSSYLIGAFNGLSGYIYTFSKFYENTKDPVMLKLIEEGLTKLRLIYEKDTTFDIIGGSAGAIKVCISLVNGLEGKVKKQAEDLLLDLSDFIIENASIIKNEHIAWQSGINDQIYTGYAHGSSGIEDALNSLYSIYPNLKIKRALDNSNKFVESMYMADKKNWKSAYDKDGYSNAWCHGAPGILYSKMKQGQIGDYHEEVKELQRNALGNNICYCHGDIGNLEILMEIARNNKDSELENKCRATFDKLSKDMLKYIKQHSLLPYGFMLGMAGMGYSLLKWSADDIPSVLFLE